MSQAGMPASGRDRVIRSRQALKRMMIIASVEHLAEMQGLITYLCSMVEDADRPPEPASAALLREHEIGSRRVFHTVPTREFLRGLADMVEASEGKRFKPSQPPSEPHADWNAGTPAQP